MEMTEEEVNEAFKGMIKKLDGLGFAIVPKIAPKSLLEASPLVAGVYPSIVQLARLKGDE